MCESIMEKEIVTGIKYLKEKHKRPSMQEIYNHVKRNDVNISMDEFKDIFDQLLESGKIVKRSGDSYNVNDDFIPSDNEIELNTTNVSEFNFFQQSNKSNKDEEDLLAMLKNMMLQEKCRDREYMDFLKSEIQFLKEELTRKSDIITSLLSKFVSEKEVETITQMTLQNSLKSQSNESANEKIIGYNKSANDNKPASNLPNDLNKNNDEHENELECKLLPNIEIIGDSHLNAINEKGLSRQGNVIVRNHSGATTKDIKSYIIPSLDKQRDVIIIHTGCNDLTNKIDTIEHLQVIVNRVKTKSANTKIAISSVFVRTDIKGMEHKVRDLNLKLKSFCDENLIDFLPHNNIEATCLGIKKLHLNKKGTRLFAHNLIDYMKQFY